MAVVLHNQWLLLESKVIFGNDPKPIGSYRLGVGNGATLSRSSSFADFALSELVGDGYGRGLVTINPALFAYENATNRVNHGVWDVTFPQVTALKQWSVAFLTIGATAQANVKLTPAAIDIATNKVTIANTWASSQTVTIYALPGGVLPAPLVSGAAYVILSVTATDFVLSSDGFTAIDLTTSGSGDFVIANTTGTIVYLDQRTTPQLWQPNRDYGVDITYTRRNVAAGNGV
jgi:hypothetical protein